MLKFLYETVFGRILLKLLTQPVCSKVGGWALNTRLSRCFVAGYIERNRIDMRRFEEKQFRSFNDFFTRRLKRDDIPHSPGLTAPCDGKASAYDLSEQNAFRIKNSVYTVESLLNNAQLAEKYAGGTCLIFRLTPDDYHRYHYIDDGEIIRQEAIRGVLHTVRPIAHGRYPVFAQNTRVYTAMRTTRLGLVTQIEVGALMVGKIVNHKAAGTFSRGEEKGYFAFGGSTVVFLLEKGAVNIRQEIVDASLRGDEIVIRIGDGVGEICKGEISK